MPLFRKRPDPLALTMALAESFGRNDVTAIARSRQALAGVSTMDILFGLFRFVRLATSHAGLLQLPATTEPERQRQHGGDRQVA